MVSEMATAKRKPAPAAKKRLSTYERRELDALQAKIAATEAEIRDLDARLVDPKLYATVGADPHALAKARQAAAATLETMLRRWVELEERA